ncbi:MAG: hypothetical protein HDR98_09715 [Bacteroides sp.]|nr:hypothetical protein [Bacteroides sp.]
MTTMCYFEHINSSLLSESDRAILKEAEESYDWSGLYYLADRATDPYLRDRIESKASYLRHAEEYDPREYL